MIKLKFVLILTFSFLTVCLSAQIKPDTLTNETVLKLLKAGFEPSVIIIKIKHSPVKFDVSTDGLIKLNSNGVPADVINAMINPLAAEKAPASNDSITLCKKWKCVSQKVNGKANDMPYEFTEQYSLDGSYECLMVDTQTHKKDRTGGRYEISGDRKQFTIYIEGRKPMVAEILKLTSRELETQFDIQGMVFISKFTVVE
jgi:hypothetical protein